MKSLSRYVVKTQHEQQDVFFNTVTKTILPVLASEQDLRDNYFLPGQEKDAINDVLIEKRTTLSINIAPTWECNLRCKHCSVLTQLTPKDEGELNIEKYEKFIKGFLAINPQVNRISINFAGGEPLLRPKTIIDVVNTTTAVMENSRFAMTTNLAVELTDQVMQALSLINQLTVSVDGIEEAHNEQRLPYKSNINPFQTTVKNIKQLQDAGMHDKISIQAALSDEHLNKDHIRAFLRLFLKMGITNIRAGCLHPAKHLGPTKEFIKHLKRPGIRSTPCCKYRTTSVYYIDSSNQIYDSYWNFSRVLLGTLDDNPAVIEKRKLSNIETMPCLKDPKCLECPVIGACWGGCVNGLTLIGDRPSRFCNQQGLIDRVQELAESGKITGILVKQGRPKPPPT